MSLKTIWFIVTGCITLASSQLPSGFNLPAITHVDRNWFAMSTDPIGSVVTRVHRERTGNQPVTFGLESSGPPAPFKIDPYTGVVTVNDTLIDKENRTYSLWVTAYDGSIPQRTEVIATITDNTGQRPKIPQPPPFALPKYPGISLQPKFTISTQRSTKATEEHFEETLVPDTTR